MIVWCVMAGPRMTVVCVDWAQGDDAGMEGLGPT
jgi:hypothetical protein